MPVIFVAYLSTLDESFEVFGIDMVRPAFADRISAKNIAFRQEIMDLMDAAKLRRVVTSFHPDYVLHLAAFSSVAYSWKHPEETFLNNSTIFMNLISAVRELNEPCRILSVGSSEEYGHVPEDALPLSETYPLQPNSPYAVARVTQERLSDMYVREFGMDIVMTRSFNHIGPGQDKRFVVPSFVDRMKRIGESGADSGEIETGNIEIIRDFVDVRDVVKAYYRLLEAGKKGEVYNVCSGKGIRLSDLIEIIAGILEVQITTRVNPEYVRPNDIAKIIGDPNKIYRELGWKAEINCEQTLRDLVGKMIL